MENLPTAPSGLVWVLSFGKYVFAVVGPMDCHFLTEYFVWSIYSIDAASATYNIINM